MYSKYLPLLPLMIACAGCGAHPDIKQPVNDSSTATANHFELIVPRHAGLAQTIKLPAQLVAYQEISVFPKVNGYVQDVLVDIGSRVKKGQLLMTLDAPEIAQQVAQAREKYARAVSDFNIDKDNYGRLKTAAATAGAIAPMDLATARAKMESDSALSNAEKANWLAQETMSGYLKIYAPFSGIITERNTHPGALVNAESKDKLMLELKEDDHLRLQVDVPEAVAAGLHASDPVTFYLSAFPGQKMTATINRIAGNVNVQYRSERVEMDVKNAGNRLAPGMYAEVFLAAKGNVDALTVPKTAVLTSTERKSIVVVRNGKTLRLDVATGNESGEEVEVIGDLQTGDRVVANPSEDVADGLAVNQGDEK